MSWFNFHRCWTGRRWVELGGWLAVGFGPDKFIERVYWKGQLKYAYRKGDNMNRDEDIT